MAQDSIDSNADAYYQRNPSADTDTNTNSHANRYSDSNTDSYPNSNRYSDSNTYCDTTTVTDGDVLSRDQPEWSGHNYRRPQLGGQYIDYSQFQHEWHGL